MEPVTGPLQNIGQIAIVVRDIHRAREFYQAKLGLTHLFSAGPMEFFDCGGVRLMLSQPENSNPQSTSILYFNVEDIQAVYEEFSKDGVEFLGKPHSVGRHADKEVWMAFFRDSEGNTLALMSETSSS